MAYYVVKIPNVIGYQDALDLQAKAFELVDKNVLEGVLFILEHKPVLTMGIRTEEQNLLVSEEYLKDHGVELFQTDRGGDITFHGPGQIVAYPILRFRQFGLKLSDYMHTLEDIIIDTLKNYDIDAYSKPEFPGVWIDNRKVCAIGVRAKKFIVYHGLAFNVQVDKNYFNLINPCGITEYEICSMNDVYDTPDIELVKTEIIRQFESHLNVTFKPMTVDELLQK